MKDLYVFWYLHGDVIYISCKVFVKHKAMGVFSVHNKSLIYFYHMKWTYDREKTKLGYEYCIVLSGFYSQCKENQRSNLLQLQISKMNMKTVDTKIYN